MNTQEAKIIRYKAYLKVKQKKCDALLKLLEESRKIVCSYRCPNVWKTGQPQPHCELCEQIQKETGGQP